MHGMLQSLPERRAAVSPAVRSGADIQVRIDIDDANFPPAGCVAEEMAVRRLVASAQHDGNGAALQHGRHDICQHGLAFFQVC